MGQFSGLYEDNRPKQSAANEGGAVFLVIQGKTTTSALTHPTWGEFSLTARHVASLAAPCTAALGAPHVAALTAPYVVPPAGPHVVPSAAPYVVPPAAPYVASLAVPHVAPPAAPYVALSVV
jgi:hypothetical protein